MKYLSNITHQTNILRAAIPGNSEVFLYYIFESMEQVSYVKIVITGLSTDTCSRAVMTGQRVTKNTPQLR